MGNYIQKSLVLHIQLIAIHVMSVLIDEKYLELAVRSLHTAFGLDRASGESRAQA